MQNSKSYELLKKAIIDKVHITAREKPLIDRATGVLKDDGWLFDFRKVIFRKHILKAVADVFWERFASETPLQIGGIETAALPIITAISLAQPDSLTQSAQAFFVRKSRKKDGLMQMIEGDPATPEIPVILVDDILNSGKSFIRQVEVLEELGYRVKAIWSILRFRDTEFYDYFHTKNIDVHSLFELDDFKNSLGVSNIRQPECPKPLMPFSIEWKFSSNDPNHFYVVPKSDPVLDSKRVYFGSDSGYFWALNQKDGSTAWSYKVGYHAKGKSIFSSPVLHKNTVIFGAYDGNVYALDSKTGQKKWIFWEADTIGSSPTVSEDLGLVFVGLEFGLIRKRGGIAALNVKTGKKEWEHSMVAYTHSSPLYIPEKKQVVVGGNEGIAYLFDAKNGKLVWEFKTGTTTEDEQAHGFSRFDIKESFAYDAKRDMIIFGNNNAQVFAVDRKTGKKAWCFDDAQFGFYSTPLIYKDTVIVSSLDKNLYSIDLHTGKELWRWNAGARIFASPALIENKIYIGANTGRMSEINPENGEERAFMPVPERITNKVAYNIESKRFFLPTFANELYCLKRREDGKEK